MLHTQPPLLRAASSGGRLDPRVIGGIRLINCIILNNAGIVKQNVWYHTGGWIYFFRNLTYRKEDDIVYLILDMGYHYA